jgi:hypothetical protein
MSETAATYTHDECGYQAAGLALVVEHLRAVHGVTGAGEVGSIDQRARRLILCSGDPETIIDLDAWLREALGDQ